MKKHKYGVFMKVKYEGYNQWNFKSTLVEANSKYEAIQKAEKIYTKQEDCEWVRTISVEQYK